MNLNMFMLASGDAAAVGTDTGSIITMVVMYAAVFGGLYFFLIRPNSKKKKEEAQLRNNLEIGDDITTIGGIVGRVVAIKEEADEIVIETGADRVKMRMKKWCISTVDTVKETPESTEKKKKGFFSRNKDN